jgi:two-component system, LytTR family, sensor kinase
VRALRTLAGGPSRLEGPVSTRLALVALTATPVCGYALLWNLSVVHYYSMISDPAALASVMAPGARVVEHLVLLPCLMALYFLASGPGWTRGSWLVVIPKQVALLVIFGLAVRPAYYLGYLLWGVDPPAHRDDFVSFLDVDSVTSSFINYSMIYALGLFLLFGLIVFEKYRAGQVQLATMSANLLRARIEALRSQLHPHFLFNTLNTISSLVASRPETARELIIALSTLLRDSVDMGHQEFHSLGRECELCEAYIRIMSVRFGSRFQCAALSAGALSHRFVPHGIVLTLLENAVTHGVAVMDGPCTVSVTFAAREPTLAIQVRNTYTPKITAEPGRRGGLAILQARLESLFGNECRIKWRTEDQAYWIVDVELPAVNDENLATHPPSVVGFPTMEADRDPQAV